MRQFRLGAMLGILGFGWEQLLASLWALPLLSGTQMVLFAVLYTGISGFIFGTIGRLFENPSVRWWVFWSGWAALLLCSKAWVWKWSIESILGLGGMVGLLGIMGFLVIEHRLFRHWPAAIWPLRCVSFLALSAVFFINLNVYGAVTAPEALWMDAYVMSGALLVLVGLSLSPMGYWSHLSEWHVALGALLVWLGVGVQNLKPESPATATGEGGTSGAPVVLIVVDTLRADHLGFMGYAPPTSPRLDALASTAVSFQRAQSAAPWTLPAFGSLLTGVVPSLHGAGINLGQGNTESRLGVTRVTLAEMFSAAGYGTAAVVSNAYLKKGYGLDRGFDTYDDVVSMGYMPLLFQPLSMFLGPHWMGRPYRSADEMATAARAVIDDQQGAPFFLLLHFMDPHDPYFPRQDDVALMTNGSSAVRLYDAEIRGVDRAIGSILDTLPDEAIVVVTSDHGEMFGEHDGAYSDWHPPNTRHGMTQYQELLHVPLLIRAPNLEPKAIERAVSTVDLAANVAQLVGLNWMGGGEQWPELYDRSVPTGQPAISESIRYGRERKAVRLGDWKAIYGPDKEELYYLRSDPGEQKDVGTQFPDIVEGLRVFLPVPPKKKPVAADPSSAEQEALRQLGYVDE